MKTLALLMFLCTILPAAGQVVSNVNWELENNERIVITYDLAKEGTYIYFDVSVKALVDNKAIKPAALSGDVGSFVKVGTGKKIIWNMFQDITELNGELTIEVLAFNPVPSTATVDPVEKTTVSPEMNLPAASNVPFWVGMGGIGATGLGLLMNGLKSNSEGQDLYAIYRDNTVENAAVYGELGSTRNEVYDEANKKHKTGSILTIAGGAVLATAGIIMVNRIIQMKKLKQRGISFTPYIDIDQPRGKDAMTANAGLTMTLKLR
jgi:hypothetical protein